MAPLEGVVAAMIRFIDLGRQIAVDETDEEWPRQFAFYNTVSDEFISLSGMGYVWDSWEDILEYAPDESPELMQRLWSVSPDWAKGDVNYSKVPK